MEVTCKLGEKGCWNDGKCRATSNCENKVVTNADKIRAMTDEELAKLIVKHKPVHSWCKGVREIWMQPNVTKEQAWVKWLQQPAEEESQC